MFSGLCRGRSKKMKPEQFANLIVLPLLWAALISSGTLVQAHGPSQVRDAGFVVSPYVQLAETDSIYVVWQLEHRKQKTLGVEYGLTEKLGQTQSAELVAGQYGASTSCHRVESSQPRLSHRSLLPP